MSTTHNGGGTTDPLIRETLFALESLMRMFAIERVLYLLCTLVGFVLLVASLWLLISTKQLNLAQLSGIFGSSGLIAVSATRVGFFLNKSFDLITKIIEKLLALRTV